MKIIRYTYNVAFLVVAFVLTAVLVSSCGSHAVRSRVDGLNDRAYAYHYRNLDSAVHYAREALALSGHYKDGRAEALNNLAFVLMARMDYVAADSLLDEVLGSTDNQIELFVANVQKMRLCQRMSDSRRFYKYRQQAETCSSRIAEDNGNFTDRQQRRLIYARSEFSIVLSTYFYYVGLRQKSAEALSAIDAGGPIVKDTAQLLAYYYNVGSGGVLTARSRAELLQAEFDYLMRCYLLSRQYHYAFWEANSLQAISEHLQSSEDRRRLVSDNIQEIDFLNVDHMPDSLLAGNLAQRALNLFAEYGDIYQKAGAWRTLSESYFAIADYSSALICLENALSVDTAVNAAPDLVASIREQLSMVYSAMDDKHKSDYNRNIYLDMQERTRQDRFLEARADQLAMSSRQLDMMISAVLLMILVAVASLVYIIYRQRKNDSMPTPEAMSRPYERWKAESEERHARLLSEAEQIEESTGVAKYTLERYRERNVEQRAKVWLASSVTSLIGRMVHEIKCVANDGMTPRERAERLDYVSQITDAIVATNSQLTRWIQLRQGDFMLHIESFALKEVFDTIRQNVANFKLSGVSLDVDDTGAYVKADRTLTLFMINTIADNARRYTPAGGRVHVYSSESADYVEISIDDNGCGMSREKQESLFKHSAIVDSSTNSMKEGGHGFGLLNCKGIIEKYKKLSVIFSVCMIGVESEKGKGSRLFFRLPKGMVRMAVGMAMLMSAVSSYADNKTLYQYRREWKQTCAFADSAYYSNINGSYRRTVDFADSCLAHANAACALLAGHGARGSRKLVLLGDYPAMAADLEWFRDSVPVDYGVLLDVRNETAVAALALHRWSLYNYNNAVYTQLFRACSADNALGAYVKNMQRAENNRNVAIFILVVLFVAIFPTYYMLYYRRRMSLHLYIDRMNEVNAVLADANAGTAEKLQAVKRVWNVESENGHGANLPPAIMREANASGRYQALNELVDNIVHSLETDIARTRKLLTDIEIARDELRRVRMDCDRMYISNNVLDNCLSSLKHETMYYPSRLKQLFLLDEGSMQSVSVLGELAGYYQLLYMTFIKQAHAILDSAGSFVAPRLLMNQLLRLLRKKNKDGALSQVMSDAHDGYVLIDINICNEQLVSAVGQNASILFSQDTPDTDFLVCCQIMRDIGEYTGARACGISAKLVDSRHIMIRITASVTAVGTDRIQNVADSRNKIVEK